MHGTKFWKLGKWIAVGVGTVTATVAVTMTPTKLSASSAPPAPKKPEGGFPKWDYNWDKREPYSLLKPPKKGKPEKSVGGTEQDMVEKLEKNKCKAIRYLILIRHGQYNCDTEEDSEKKLTPLGEEQAALAGQRLKRSGVSFSSLVSSNMIRAEQTAEIILKNLSQEGLEISCRDPFLREGAPCLAEPPSSTWHPDRHYYEDGARIEAAFRKYFHRADPDQEEDSYEIIVCHANVIRYFVCRALQFPPEAWLRISLIHSSLTMFSILPSGRVTLHFMGDSGHLPAAKMTTF